MLLVTRIVSNRRSRTLVTLLATVLAATGCELDEHPGQSCDQVVTTPECVTACDPVDCDDDDFCTEDECSGGICYHDAIPGCMQGPLSGVVGVFADDNGNATMFGVYSPDESYGTYLQAQADALAAIEIGACVERTNLQPPAGTTLRSVGHIVIKDGDDVLADVAPDANNRYDSAQMEFLLAIGAIIGLELTGSADAAASESSNAVKVPARAVFGNLTFTNDVINGTFMYSPVDTDELILHIEYFSFGPPPASVRLRCRLDPAGTTFTIPADIYAAMGSSGSLRVESSNIRHVIVNAIDAVRSMSVTTSTSTPQGSYSKAP